MWHLLPATGHHGPSVARGCPLQPPVTEPEDAGLLAAAGLGPVTVADSLLQRLRSSPGAARAVVLGWYLVQGQELLRLS